MTPLQRAIDTINIQCSDEILAATLRGLIRGYDARWHTQQLQIDLESTEQTLVSPLYNIKTKRPSRSHRMAGKSDKLAYQHGQLTLFDHKTTSSDITDPNSDYWRQLQVESQHYHYELLLLQHGIRPDRIVWDVVRKPGIRPKLLTKVQQREIANLGTWNDQPISDDTRRYVIGGGDRETPEIYEARLVEEVATNPERYYARRAVVKTREELLEYAKELWMLSKEILRTRRENLHYKNSGACMNYGRACDYLGICSGHDSPDSDRWAGRESVHPELDLDDSGQDVLTNSRLSCFQTCRRKHYYRYELGIQRADKVEAEALYFGHQWHLAMDAWWSGFLPERQDDGDDSNSASEVEHSTASQA